VRDQVIGMPGVKQVVTPPSLEELITSGTIQPSLYEQLTTGSSSEERSGETCQPAGRQIK